MEYEYNDIDIDYFDFFTSFDKTKFLCDYLSESSSIVTSLDNISDLSGVIDTTLLNDSISNLKDIVDKNSGKIVKFFDDLEKRIGTEAFKELIPVILTDRDPCFSDILGICFSKITGEERCQLFFCDPYVSNQKPNVENINKQIRKFFPKGKSVDSLTKENIKNHNLTLLKTPIKSLDGNTPEDAFKVVYGEDLYYKLFDIVNGEQK